MKKFKSTHFAVLVEELQRLEDECEYARVQAVTVIPGSSGPPEKLAEVIEWLKDAAELSMDLGLEKAETSINLIINHLETHPDSIDYSSLCADLRNAENAFMIEFWKMIFIEVPVKYSQFVNSDVLLGPEVSLIFKSAVPDMREAGNCIAIDCGTAAIFHLMRAVEWGLRAFCRHLGILKIPKSKKLGKKKYVLIEYSQWEKIFDEMHERVDKKINALAPGVKKQNAQVFYFPLLAICEDSKTRGAITSCIRGQYIPDKTQKPFSIMSKNYGVTCY